ncbi:MAG: 7-cyano-7-deazaguanine synthase QueC [Bacteroidia bacterium]|nr:7-cyano-7-deazaguanine synthase QueC [Bacteroidia bacterium]MCX7652565.1 7-cyano-7-deazaguanine synthase QueC [Bacteroidia bacterium]MDW8417559.1 7-cyano-7-deazaguanine synthase QueC [Bacteroidia bacterium]
MPIVLLSGGQDSTTALIWAMENLSSPFYAISFLYSQRHQVEIACARRIAGHFGIPHETIDLGPLWQSLSIETSLTAEKPISYDPEGLPTTFVPGRNLFFLTAAAAWGYKRGETELVIGVSQVDYSGYPDCRAPFIAAAEKALSEALARTMRIHAPFLYTDKAGLWKYAAERGYREFIAEETHTCYLGERFHREPWGYGCGKCPACVLRKAGYEAAFG